jgi:diguanylate cyclase (GGDEF)-like protein
MEGVMRDKKLITLGYLDLDGLKYVNDHYGHSEGDSYIMSFAKLIKQNFRRDDVFARIGGDEFCIVLEGDRYDLTVEKLEKIREVLIAKNEKPYPVSFSYGVHILDGGKENTNVEEVIDEADAQMYEYKRENKRERKQ